ncbi:MAG: DUF302 domain-containing protein [Gammaproteobacteria bacterium]
MKSFNTRIGRPFRILGTLLILAATSLSAQAENLLMSRTTLPFEQARAVLMSAIEEHGYTIAHEQKCDGGLGDFGYKTDLYRLFFFGKKDEIRALTAKYPQLIPYLPLKIAIIAEDKESIISVVNPDTLEKLFPEPELEIQFARWKSDFESILTDVRKFQMLAETRAAAAK